ncbi:FMRFamide receptor [Folsomia candida]|uniref:FMRFamide receptor n=1 Tax=Folsomia candida TaxID=158441 RepID=A0A226D350_FOLCA|nr:FMRFamide receptor [Folsomia candida]OXA39649.1 FMRFamide receptor [Folsomia candida]
MEEITPIPEWHTPVTETMKIVILIVCILGIFTNFLCLCVLLRKRMKSSFNTILLGLTIFDLLLLSKGVFTSLNQLTNYTWPLNQTVWAPRALFFLSWLCDSGTKYFTVGVSLERYVAICHPLRARSLLTNKTSRIFAAALSLYVLALSATNFYLRFYSNGLLTEKEMNIVKAVFLNFGPFIAICLLNVAIYARLQKSKKLRKSSEPTKSPPMSSAVTRMLLTVVVVFGFCYSFECTRRIIGYFIPLDLDHNNFHFFLNLLADFFYVVNSSVNFLIYYLLGKKFRAEFLTVFACSLPHKKGGIMENGKQVKTAQATSSTGDTTSTDASTNTNMVLQ